MFWKKSNDSIEFLCDPRLDGVIPKPFPAKQFIPNWYKRLESYHKEENRITPLPTLKRCPPFLDAMSAGWIIPLVADVHLNVIDDGAGVSWESDFIYPIIENHKLPQVATHPKAPKIPLKILNYWMVKTPPGWSSLFITPINRIDDKLELMAGIVETDNYYEYVNFPGFVKVSEGYFKLDSGYPLMQVIPFKREYNKVAKIQTFSSEDIKKRQINKDRHSSNPSHYRDNVWVKKI